MKRILFIITGIMVLLQCSESQSNRERRLILNDYVAPEELVSMAKDLPFDKAMLLFSDFSKRYLNKIIVDASNEKKQIGIDVENKYWLQAFEEVLRANAMWYDEREEFFYVFASDAAPVIDAKGAVVAQPAVKQDSMGRMLFRQRDIRISSVFFNIDVVKSLNAGINWSFSYLGDSTSGTTPTRFGGEFNAGFLDPGAAGLTSAGFLGRVVPAIKFSNVNALISFFQSNQLGDVLSGPSIVVSSGKKGRIQVGQDIFITTRDISGNTIQQPVSSGIIIDVTPTVYDEKGIMFVNLDIKAERSTVSAGPTINKSSAQTFSVLYDGEETVIGGLYTTAESTERGGIPYLKDLPWWVFGLRYLFGYDKTSVVTQELIILLKAEVVPTIEERVATAAERKGMNLIEQERAKTAAEIERLKNKK
ncbi:MAG: type II secretion system protein GspD [Bacteroidota bacterium]